MKFQSQNMLKDGLKIMQKNLWLFVWTQGWLNNLYCNNFISTSVLTHIILIIIQSHRKTLNLNSEPQLKSPQFDSSLHCQLMRPSRKSNGTMSLPAFACIFMIHLKWIYYSLRSLLWCEGQSRWHSFTILFNSTMSWESTKAPCRDAG